MTSRTLTRLMGTSLIIATTMAGCSGAQMQHRPASAEAPGTPARIEAALAARQFADALLGAEQLAEAEPRAPAVRVLLGRAYLANGRYRSARTAFQDAMTLGASDVRTIVSLALVHTALGDARAARTLLASHAGALPAADYGLAMAMAGDANEGVRALLDAARQPDATATTRQNLAYALALNGQWGQARLVAGQDMDGSRLQERLEQWAATAAPDAGPQRVAALLGIGPRADDAGQPERLALSRADDAALAQVEPLPQIAPVAAEAVPVPVPVPEQSLASTWRETTAIKPVAIPASEQAGQGFAPQPATPLIAAPADPMRQALLQRLAEPAPAPAPAAKNQAERLVSTAPSAPARMATTGMSDWVVQIGAYSDSARVTIGWKRAVGRKLGLDGFRHVSGTVTVGGKTFHRLAVSGFADRAAATKLCASLQAKGQTCFVRRDEGVASEIRMARAGKAASGQLASR